jgi:hypothetical protein
VRVSGPGQKQPFATVRSGRANDAAHETKGAGQVNRCLSILVGVAHPLSPIDWTSQVVDIAVRGPASCACLRPPLMSNVRGHKSARSQHGNLIRRLRAYPFRVRLTSAIVGAWRLESTVQRLAGGTVRASPLYGPNGVGYLIYSASGHMAALQADPGREHWSSEDKPTERERQPAMRRCR